MSSSVIQQRWRTRQLVGDKKHALIVRVRPGYMKRDYMDENRIDDGDTPFDGSPIFPPLIWKGNNHHPWQGLWTPTGSWQTLPNIESAKWARDFDIQTGAAKGTSTATVVMDNIAFPQATGVGGIYHAIQRGYFSPDRGNVPDGRANIWPKDIQNPWHNALNSGYQIELWEGYGTGNDIVLRTTLDPTTNSYAPASGALDRTWTGIVVDFETESHPDKITLTAQDFGIFFTDQRLVGDNKDLAIRSPVIFADRRQTQGENKVTQPLTVSSGLVSQDRVWQSQTGTSGPEWIEMKIPFGTYIECFIAPQSDMELFVSLRLGDGGVMDRTVTLPNGWVTLAGPGTGTTPDGTPYFRHIANFDTTSPTRIALGHQFDVGQDAHLRLTFNRLPGQAVTKNFIAYQYGSNPAVAPGPGVNAKHWILVDDAAQVVRMLCIWAGFKEWKIEDFGWSLFQPLVFGEGKFFMDVITDMLQQGYFIFYMGPPTADDRSIGVPHFEHVKAIDPPRQGMIEVRDTDMTEALDIKWDLSSLPWVMRYRGKIDPKYGVVWGQDLTRRVMATYYPPWTGRFSPLAMGETAGADQIRRIAGIHRHFTETMASNLRVSLQTYEECLFACILAAIQYGLQMCTGRFQIPGVTGLKLNDAISVVDEATATNSRIWIAAIESEHVMGGDHEGYWRMTVGGSMIDSREFGGLRDDYNFALILNKLVKG